MGPARLWGTEITLEVQLGLLDLVGVMLRVSLNLQEVFLGGLPIISLKLYLDPNAKRFSWDIRSFSRGTLLGC